MTHSNGNSESNLVWSDESLILYYYEELNIEETDAISKALDKSTKLQQQYQGVCELLDEKIAKEMPQPSVNLNQNIMAAVHRSIQQTQTGKDLNVRKEAKTVDKLSIIHRLFGLRQINFALSLSVIALVGVSIFYVGRWSAIEKHEQIAKQQGSKGQPSVVFTKLQSERVLHSNLTQHLDSGARLLTAVSNGNGDLAEQMHQRREFVDELISFNRLYRRIIEKSGDKQLAHTLFQMESLLIEIYNSTSDGTDSSPLVEKSLLQIRERLDSSDLLFKLRVTDKRNHQKII